MIYIALKDNKIIHVCETISEENVIKSMAYEGILEYDSIESVSNEHFLGKPGNDIREFDTGYDFKPEIERMAEGYIDIPEGKKLNETGTELIDKTTEDKINSGEITLKEHQKYDDLLGNIRDKTAKEMCVDGTITINEFKDYRTEEIKCSFDNEFVNGHFMSQAIGIEVDYRRYDKKNDKQNVEALISYMIEENIPSVQYKGYERQRAQSTVLQLQALVKEMNAHGVYLYEKKDSLVTAIENALVIEVIDSIAW